MAEYYFRLPLFEELNPAQRTAVLDDNPIALSGGPGTGKSSVSLWRHILNHKRENLVRSQLLTYTTSLALYLKSCCDKEDENASRHVDSSKNWCYKHASNRAEIIHDEAQDLPLAFNDNLKKFSDRISYGADDQQLITSEARNQDGTYNIEKCSPENNLREIFLQNSPHTLSRNYRNSKRIMSLAQRLFINAVIPREIINSCPIEGEFPRLIITGHNNEKINDSVIQLIRDTNVATNETINVGILVPFENPNRHAGETATVQYYYNLISNSGFDCSMYTNAMQGAKVIKNIHVTTFKSAKGLEFDFVIIPDFHLFNITFRGVEVIVDSDLMYSYLHSVGNMHYAKMKAAFHFLSFKDLVPPIEIINWGCGQAIASITYLEYINKQNIKTNNLQITLIEPSEDCIKRAALHVKHFNDIIEVKTICKDIDSLSENDILTFAKNIKIHFFSNILDVEGFSLSKLVSLIEATQKGINYFVCVSPHIEDVKNDRIDSFKRHFTKHDTFKLLGQETDGKIGTYWNCNNHYNNYALCHDHEQKIVGFCKNKWSRIIRVFRVNFN